MISKNIENVKLITSVLHILSLYISANIGEICLDILKIKRCAPQNFQTLLYGIYVECFSNCAITSIVLFT